jgi:pSer/pThr/pTyr-binding forkhead associated (FHA) protein
LALQPQNPEQELRFWIEYGGHRFELRPGTVLIGRAAGCQIMLEDALVSRKHAQLVVTTTRVSLEDFGSVNGVFVNAQRIAGSQPLSPGDRIVIGKQEMMLRAAPHVALAEPASGRLVRDTLHGAELGRTGAQPALGDAGPLAVDDDAESTRQGTALELLGGVAEKTLALGRGEEAERILSMYLLNMRAAAQQAGFIEQQLAEKAIRFAVKLAQATGKGSWVDYAFDVYRVIKRPLPADVVDQLYTVLRSVREVDLQRLRDYLADLKSAQAQGRFSPSERFVLQRLEGLERLASSR